VTQSELGLDVHPAGEKAPVISAEVRDGVFTILFRCDSLGYNTSSAYDLIVPALEEVPRDTYVLRAQHSIEVGWNDEVEDLQQEIGDILAMPDVILDPNFEEVYAALLKGKQSVHLQFVLTWPKARRTIKIGSETLGRPCSVISKMA
jgi:hypothetical protein